MSPLRVLVVSQYFWPENFRVNDLCVELVARGHEVTVLTGLPNYPGRDDLPGLSRAPGRFRAASTASKSCACRSGRGSAIASA